MNDPDRSEPHQGQPLERAGEPTGTAEAAAIFLHGRGASARGILQMSEEFRDDVAYLAPQAMRNTWYPNSFLAPIESNEPGRTSGLRVIADAVEVVEDANIPPERILLLGFSQGACLASEYVATNPRRYGGLAALSGGLIGETVEAEEYDGDLEGTPVFLGCSDSDPHIPEERVHETASVLNALGGDVTSRIYEGMGHTVNADEIATVSDMIDGLFVDDPTTDE